MTTTKPINTASQSTAATTTSRTAPTRTISVGGTPFAYRELGPHTGVPLVLLWIVWRRLQAVEVAT